MSDFENEVVKAVQDSIARAFDAPVRTWDDDDTETNHE